MPYPSMWVTMMRAVRKSDVVHVHDVLYPPAWIAAVCCIAFARPMVLTQHVALVDHPSWLVRSVQALVYRTMGRLVLRRARRVYVLNGRVHDFVTGLGVTADRVHLLPNGVDTERFHPVSPEEQRAARRALGLPQSGVLALFVGRFVPKKGYDAVLAAASAQVPPSYSIALAGGELDAETPGVTVGAIVGLGALDRRQMALAYRAADVFVLPSQGEGFPLTVQEAMASGLPVITTDDPGYASYGLDRRYVRLIEPDVAHVRRALEELSEDPDLRERMSVYSRATAIAAFSWEAHCDHLVAGYDACRADASMPGVTRAGATR
jgi:glycosyltransferase involved in cell wall biosynthesis